MKYLKIPNKGNLLLSVCGALTLSVLNLSIARAQVPDTSEVSTFSMTVSPAAAPKPALRHQLLVPGFEQVNENAATYYYKAIAFNGPDRINQTAKSVFNWLATPVDELPQEQVAQNLQWLTEKQYLDTIRAAARCSDCDWKDPIRQDGVNALLPQTQKLRGLARVLSLQARLKAAQGRHADAVETLRLLYSLSRHFGSSQSLVQALVGMAIASDANAQTRVLIESPNSPNLYWALTELASQPIDLREPVAFESRLIEFTFPKLTTLENGPLSAEDAFEVAKDIWATYRNIPQEAADTPLVLRAELMLWASQLHQEARKYLAAQDFDAATLESMPVLQVALLYRWKQFEEQRDLLFKWSFLPVGEYRDVRSNLAKFRRDIFNSEEGLPFTYFLPALESMYVASLRSQRETALLRTIEALRMHAAEQGGWPKTLSEVTVVPVPMDPDTDQPFEYSLEGDTATLYAPMTKSPSRSQSDAIRYKLTLRR